MTDLEEMFRDLEGCCLHDPQWRPSDVADEVVWIGDRQTGTNSSAIVIVRLNDQAYGLLTESEDFTGHGCQCDSMTVREPTLHALLGHLDEHELAQMIRR